MGFSTNFAPLINGQLHPSHGAGGGMIKRHHRIYGDLAPEGQGYWLYAAYG